MKYGEKGGRAEKGKVERVMEGADKQQQQQFWALGTVGG